MSRFERLQDRGLAGARTADERDELSGRDRERNASDDVAIAVALAEVDDFDCGSGHVE